MPPNGVDDITPNTVVKKLKDEAFAAGANWEQVGPDARRRRDPGYQEGDLLKE
jgi:predicted hydrolase (HD superfamily)